MGGEPKLLVTNAWLLTMADGVDPYRGWLSVGRDGRIAGLGPGVPPPVPGAAVLDAGGALVAPGFLSAHSHLHTSGLRGIAASETLYPWAQANLLALLGADAEDLYWFTLHGALDFIDNGITTAFNFPQSRVMWGYDATADQATPARIHTVDFVARQYEAIADSGLRACHAIRLDDEAVPEPEALATFGELVAHLAGLAPADRQLGAAVFGAVQWSRSPRTAALEARVMADYGIINQAHFVETAERIDQQRAKFAWYAEAGMLGPRMLFGHFVHPTDEMVAQVAAAGSPVVWQPTSNGRLGSGVADVVRLRTLGIPVGVGLDDQSCTDISDPFQNLRIGLYAMRALHQDAAVLTPREMLRLHTLGSAEVLGVADRVGSLEVGKFADFLVVDPSDPDTGPIWDSYATYVLACGLRNLKQVYIGGECVSKAGRSRSRHAQAARSELHHRMARAATRAGLPLADIAVEAGL